MNYVPWIIALSLDINRLGQPVFLTFCLWNYSLHLGSWKLEWNYSPGTALRRLASPTPNQSNPFGIQESSSGQANQYPSHGCSQISDVHLKPTFLCSELPTSPPYLLKAWFWQSPSPASRTQLPAVPAPGEPSELGKCSCSFEGISWGHLANQLCNESFQVWIEAAPLLWNLAWFRN